jgi:tetraacyldisaccharide 4'-kinase
VLGRGYGGHAPGDELDEEGRSLVRDLPEVRVVQGRDRGAAIAPWLEGPERPTAVILDDGMQHLQLRRDLEIVLVDARRPFGNGLLLPAGPLREPPRALRRADLIVATRSGGLTDAARRVMVERLARYGFGVPVLSADHVPERLLPDGGSPVSLAGRRVHLVAAIAHPCSFVETVRTLGAEVCGITAFRDHHEFRATDLRAIEAAARAGGADLVVATGKDAPKLSGAEVGMELVFLEIAMELGCGDGARLDAALDVVLSESGDGP